VVWGVLGVEEFCPFCVGVDGGCHVSEGGEDLVCSWSGEGDVFGWEDSSTERDVLGKVVGREPPCDFRGDGEVWDSESRGPVKFVEDGSDGRDVREELESFPGRVPEGSRNLDEGPVLDLLKFVDQSLVGFLRVEPELGAVGDGGDDHRLVEEAEVGRGYALNSVAENFEAGDCGETLLTEQANVVGEGEFAV